MRRPPPWRPVELGCLIVALLPILASLVMIGLSGYLMLTGNNWLTYLISHGECWRYRDCLR